MLIARLVCKQYDIVSSQTEALYDWCIVCAVVYNYRKPFICVKIRAVQCRARCKATARRWGHAINGLRENLVDAVRLFCYERRARAVWVVAYVGIARQRDFDLVVIHV